MSDEPFLTLSQVCSRLPGARGARRVAPSTVTRWIVSGCPSRTGERVKLTAVRAGGRWLVRAADLDVFFAALAADPTPAAAPPRSPAARNRASERAAAALRGMG